MLLTLKGAKLLILNTRHTESIALWSNTEWCIQYCLILSILRGARHHKNTWHKHSGNGRLVECFTAIFLSISSFLQATETVGFVVFCFFLQSSIAFKNGTQNRASYKFYLFLLTESGFEPNWNEILYRGSIESCSPRVGQFGNYLVYFQQI